MAEKSAPKMTPKTKFGAPKTAPAFEKGGKGGKKKC